MLRDNPIPSTPVDDDIVAFLGQEFPHKLDKCLSKIQGTTVAVAAPLATLWANLIEQKLTGEAALIAADDVVETIQRSLSLLGNSINYISQARRDVIISKLETKKKGLAKIMRKASKSDLTDAKNYSAQHSGRFSRKKRIQCRLLGRLQSVWSSLLLIPTGFFEGAPPQANTAVAGAEAQDRIPTSAPTETSLNRPNPKALNKQRTQNQPKPHQ